MMSIPYDGRCYYLSPELSDEYRTKGYFSVFNEQKKKLFLFYGIHTVGGAYLVNKDVYCSIGGENEHFYGWSAEDAENVKRMEIMGYQLHKVSGALYHLFHPRNNSRYTHPSMEINSLSELIKVSEMSPEGLEAYINTWEWL